MILDSILSTILLQAPDAAAVVPDTLSQAAPQVIEQELSVWDLCLKGGFIMIPLLALSLVCIYILVERSLVLKAALKEDRTFMKRIKDYITEGEFESAMKLCKNTNTPYARLIQKGVSRIGRPMNDVLVAIENVGNLEVARLEKGFSWLATTAAGAPMIGFLGTVIGMVEAFFALASAGGSANVSILANGIYEALVTTVAGLIVGIIAMFAYNYLVSRVNRVMNQLEAKTMEFMDLLNEPVKKYKTMALKRQHNMMSGFSMASMTDVIFLLLIFFMVTSTFVFPTALEVNLPQSGEQTAIKPGTRVYLDKDFNIFAQFGDEEPQQVDEDQLIAFLTLTRQQSPDSFIALYADESVPYGKVVEILDKSARANLKMVLATKPIQNKPAK